MKESSVPILIVGGGAAGTMLTLELARRGVAARTIDRLAHAAASSRAITLQARTAEMLERIDKRLIDRYLERGVHNHGYVLHLVDAQGERRVVRPAIDFTTLDSRYPYILMHRQNETEQYLREYTSAHFGRWTEWSTECVDDAQDAIVVDVPPKGVIEDARQRFAAAVVRFDSVNVLAGAVLQEQ
jgi:2-polyprenyl-6-methoxyphenol hydroxylase-like FAD-dependent oxidoreductase